MSTRLVGVGPWSVMVLSLLLFPTACSTVAPAPAHYAQSMNSAVDGCLRNPACVASMPGDEATIPWLSRALQTARTLVTLKEFLDEAEVRRIETILVECAKEADFLVNEREYGPGKYPDDAECDRLVRDKEGKEVKRAIELGNMKHELAFACVQRRLFTEFPDNVSVEPRYAPGPVSGQYVLTNRWTGSLRPDIVLHFARNPTKVQCVYDFKFPCTSASKSNPLGPDGSKARQQLLEYDGLGGNCPSGIVTPQLGISHE